MDEIMPNGAWNIVGRKTTDLRQPRCRQDCFLGDWDQGPRIHEDLYSQLDDDAGWKVVVTPTGVMRELSCSNCKTTNECRCTSSNSEMKKSLLSL